jgi:hypothetical protein
MVDLGNASAGVTRLFDAIGPVENVWLVALALALVGPLLALVAPRLFRVVGLALAPPMMVLACVATYREQTMLALGLITLAVTNTFVASWARHTLRETVGPLRPGPRPQHRVRGVRLTRAQSRSFDYLVMRAL